MLCGPDHVVRAWHWHHTMGITTGHHDYGCMRISDHPRELVASCGESMASVLVWSMQHAHTPLHPHVRPHFAGGSTPPNWPNILPARFVLVAMARSTQICSSSWCDLRSLACRGSTKSGYRAPSTDHITLCAPAGKPSHMFHYKLVGCRLRTR